MQQNIRHATVLAHSEALPSFPRVVNDILATIEDPDGSINVLAQSINNDPLIAARVLASANTPAARARLDREVTDVRTATAFIGMGRVREIALISSLSSFMQSLGNDARYARLWTQGVATGVCCQEIALHTTHEISLDAALIAGLLHHIGQLWLYTYAPADYRDCRDRAAKSDIPLHAAELEQFGVDHATIGKWLTQHWGLPDSICEAIACYLQPDLQLRNLLVPVLHVAQVLSNALDLGQTGDGRVWRISPAACQRLGIVWDRRIHSVFGRIEARSRHATHFFQEPPASPVAGS
jgi:HD-like signal output (HDOD) protein